MLNTFCLPKLIYQVSFLGKNCFKYTIAECRNSSICGKQCHHWCVRRPLWTLVPCAAKQPPLLADVASRLVIYKNTKTHQCITINILCTAHYMGKCTYIVKVSLKCKVYLCSNWLSEIAVMKVLKSNQNPLESLKSCWYKLHVYIMCHSDSWSDSWMP